MKDEAKVIEGQAAHDLVDGQAKPAEEGEGVAKDATVEVAKPAAEAESKRGGEYDDAIVDAEEEEQKNK